MLGSSLSGTSSLRRNSAFSIYEPDGDLEDALNECRK